MGVYAAPFAIAALSYRAGALACAGEHSDGAGFAALLWSKEHGPTPLVPATEASGDVGVVDDDGKKSLRKSKSKSSRSGSRSYKARGEAAAASKKSDESSPTRAAAEANVLCVAHDNATQRIVAGFESESWAVWTDSGAPVWYFFLFFFWFRFVFF